MNYPRQYLIRVLCHVLEAASNGKIDSSDAYRMAEKVIDELRLEDAPRESIGESILDRHFCDEIDEREYQELYGSH